eukprot:CAMPEP_0203815584 /NCGR_PEP_ID=MMETSP0115-20131106/11190_1 /ASSEMBLY_ACC=CAM_ASM_000227 /TAXON_ID=33651 /ORGANISM="Bicosoecid sp, Strain ms1" /LENGTH=398 /DNA_ID=CAMNT_0050724481 /DNA_START=29 /DNA_END=1225 /DNA_ORIENTATION=-
MAAEGDLGPTVLSPIEAQRVVSVLDETLEKLAFLDSITPDVLAHRDELSALVGDEISRVILEQRALERRYEELIATRSTLKGLANKSKYKEIQLEIQNLSHALRESTKNLCRSLKDNPNIGENLLKIQKEREQLQDLLGKTVRELRDSGTFQTLVTQVQEEKAAQDRLAEIVRREKETTAAVKQLEADLQREKREHEQEMKEREQRIRTLKEELQRKKLKSSVDGRCARMEASAKTNAKLRAFTMEEEKLQETVDELRRRKDTEAMVHERTRDFLKKKQQQLSADSIEWQEKYQVHLDEKEEELKQLTAAREGDLETLNALQERFDREVAEAAAREAEAARQRELEAMKKEEEQRQRVAATLLQRGLMIGFKEKQAAIAAAGKGKKGKKGKGKKGKKK